MCISAARGHRRTNSYDNKPIVTSPADWQQPTNEPAVLHHSVTVPDDLMTGDRTGAAPPSETSVHANRSISWAPGDARHDNPAASEWLCRHPALYRVQS